MPYEEIRPLHGHVQHDDAYDHAGSNDGHSHAYVERHKHKMTEGGHILQYLEKSKYPVSVVLGNKNAILFLNKRQW